MTDLSVSFKDTIDFLSGTLIGGAGGRLVLLTRYLLMCISLTIRSLYGELSALKSSSLSGLDSVGVLGVDLGSRIRCFLTALTDLAAAVDT